MSVYYLINCDSIFLFSKTYDMLFARARASGPAYGDVIIE